ncbi:MAG: glycosyltransferase [Deltaproteobacteria bacterium]|nr:glycosyltransferase [Deltaproteobacteria bacterium]
MSELSAPLVSVVVTSYNYGRFVRQALESVAAQDYPNWECLVVDDCSQDDSPQVISEFIAQEASGRFRLVRHVTNQGQMQGFKTGLEQSKGHFVAYLDADDWWLSDMISTHVRAHLQGDTHVNISCSDLLQVDTRGQVLSTTGYIRRLLGFLAPEAEHPEPRVLWGHDGRLSVQQELGAPVLVIPQERGGIEYLWTATSGMFFRRNALELVMPDDAGTLAVCADSYLAYFSHAMGGSLIIPTAHGCYRRHGSNSYAQSLNSMFILSGDFSSRLHNSFVFPQILHHLDRNADHLRHRLGPDQYRTLRQSFMLEEPPHWEPETEAREAVSRPVAGLGPRGKLRAATRRALRRAPRGSGAKQRRLLVSRVWRRFRAISRAQDPLLADEATAAWRALLIDDPQSQALPVFDSEYYLERNPDVAKSGHDPLVHYLLWGAWEGRDPHPLFHSRFYLNRYPDVARSGSNPLTHWLLYGQREGRAPHPLFDAAYYSRSLGQAFVNGLGAMAHLLLAKGPVWSDPHVLFNCRHYLDSCPEAAHYGRHPLLHYLEKGWIASASPHPLFDSKFYEDNNPNEVRQDPVPLVDFMLRGGRERLRPSHLFDTAWYMGLHPAHRDTPLNPLEHYLTHADTLGIRPSRFFIPNTYSDVSGEPQGGQWDRLSHCKLNWLARDAGSEGEQVRERGRRGKVALAVNQHGYQVFRELQEHLAQGLRQAGAEVMTLGVDQEPPQAQWRTVIIGPHEFFSHPDGEAWLQWEGLGNAVMLNTEPLHTYYFERVLPLLLNASAVLDLDWHNTLRLRELGVKAHFLPPGWVEDGPAQAEATWGEGLERIWLPQEVRAFNGWRDAPWQERPIDVLFLGQNSERRSRFFAANASLFAGLQSFLHLVEPGLLNTAPKPQALGTEASLYLARRSKVVLHLHRTPSRYLPGHRLLLHGMAQGALVITETCDTLPPLAAGRDYLQAPIDQLPGLLEEVLAKSQGLKRGAAVASKGTETLRNRLDLAPRLRTLINTGVL